MHWFLITIGTFILSIAVSNPFYNLLIEKRIKLRILYKFILRFMLFIMGIVIVFFGLYLESI
jgi:hypothetical protein